MTGSGRGESTGPARGAQSNRNGLGAKVRVTADGKTMTQVRDGQSGYFSQSALPLYFELASAETIEKVTVEWPGGGHQTLDGPIRANQQLPGYSQRTSRGAMMPTWHRLLDSRHSVP